MGHDQKHTLNLNEAFLRYHASGVTRNIRPRARVYIQGCSTKIAKLILLADYQTSYWDPGLAGAHAVAAVLILNQAPASLFENAVKSAIRSHGRETRAQQKKAEMQALVNLSTNSKSVCLQLDTVVLDCLYGHNSTFPHLDQTITSLKEQGVWKEKGPIIGIKGELSGEGVNRVLKETLAVGLTTFCEERFAWELAAGEHPAWRDQSSAQNLRSRCLI